MVLPFSHHGSTAMRVYEALRGYIFSLKMKVVNPGEDDYYHEVTISSVSEFEDVILNPDDVELIFSDENWVYYPDTGILEWTGGDFIMRHNGGATVQHNSSQTVRVHLGLETRVDDTSEWVLYSEGGVDVRLDNVGDISVTTHITVTTGMQFKIVCFADATGTVTLYHVRASLETVHPVES